ncbi:hypothetical protein SAMN05421858_1809 [Haladaptatus litoreus]|uniref:Uncharacterized protein n=1 Tax=Haladaptatus litoreus TaxID=553468 RepID=A0A1N6Z0F7_9EURY|nr:HalOD1 output domain-containing protein [Haladaptatus litoreus]SIR20211.1 hypothetical protein SAMN05421858_1809 [Haladaptatus litoreus]
MKTAADSTPSPGNVLVFSPAIGNRTDEECVSRLSTADPSETNALFVSYKRSPEELLERWRERFGDDPASFGIIAVGTQSSASQTENDQNVVSLARPDCLGRLQTAMYLYLDQWSATDGQSVLCFDSITAMLRHVNRTTAFRFVRSLTESLRRIDVTAHFHMHPEAHDAETVAMLRPLFDTVIDGPPETGPEISPAALSVLLDSPRRRFVCRYLAEIGDTADVSAIADQIARWESEATPNEETRERVHITLRHVHLPKLAETGVVELDSGTVASKIGTDELERYCRIAGQGESNSETEPTISDGDGLSGRTRLKDKSDEAYWTVYGTDRDSVVVMLARALGTVSDVHPTELRPVLYDVVDIDALQRLAEREETSVYATFNYGEYEVVVDGGEIRLYESE